MTSLTTSAKESTTFLITNGMLIDGLGSPMFAGDILVQKDRILSIAPSFYELPPDTEIIDAAGKYVCPAFIDIHRHLDAKPLMASDMETELRQGIATAIAGNCGFSLAPCQGPYAMEKRKNDYPILGKYADTFSYSFPEYLDALKQTIPSVNIGAMIGLGAVRICLKGFSNIPFSTKELEAGKEMIAEALASGAAGVSAGIMYLPEFYTQKEEYLSLLSPLKGTSKPFVTHIRGEADSLVSSVEEVLNIAKEAQCPLEISHFKSCGMHNWNDQIHRAIEKIENARAAGQDVTVDFYPYLGGSTALTTMLPPAFVQGDMQRALEDLGHPKGVEAFRSTCAVSYSDWDNFALSLGWDRILISSTGPENAKYLGLSVEEAASRYGFDDAIQLAAHLMHSDNGQTAIINLSMDQKDVDTIAKLPYSILISDSIYADTDTPHPRMYGAFPRFYQDFVRERRILSPEAAIQKMTLLPANRMQMKDRGRLQPGSYADLVIFDPKNLSSQATYAAPCHKGSGIDLLMVNGQIRVKRDQLIGSPSGQVLTF